MATATTERRIETNQSTAISAFAALHVVFDGAEQHILYNITDKSTEEDCVAAGATAIYMKHRYSSALNVFEERAAVFTNITIMIDGEAHHPACWFTVWDDGALWEGTCFFLAPVARYTNEMLPFHEEREAYWSSRDIVVNADELPADLVAYANRNVGIANYLEDKQEAFRIKLIKKSWMNMREMTVGDTTYSDGTLFEEAYNIHLHKELDGGHEWFERVNSSLIKCGDVWVLVQDCPV